MKLIHGWYLPDSDEHFEFHLTRGPQVEERGTYQWSKIVAALNLVPDDRRFAALDIGAHVGFWTVPLARFFGCVMAWEPVPDLNACWRRNCGHMPNVTLRSAALGAKSGRLSMAAPGDNSGNWHVCSEGEDDGIAVQVERLDETGLEVVDFIKIDVEGYEHAVILGGEELIRRSKPIIVVEQKPGNAECYGCKQTDAVKLLCRWGAKVAWIKSGDYCLTW